MNILAIDTSQKTVSVALLEDEIIRAEIFINTGVNHAEILLPTIERACETAGLRIGEIHLYALTIGPGAFTGLRIGASTVKGFALATGKPVVGVSTLEALAQNGESSTRLICPMLNAQKQQVYTAAYRAKADGRLEQAADERVMNVEDLLDGFQEDVLFIGDGAAAHEKKIRDALRERAFFAAGHQQHVRAAAVGILGRRKYLDGDVLDLFRFTPRYLRLSEAEVRLNVRQT
jgi:tRNA threonylcarbamoyladenosine biosynthesis protein TsaB